MARMYQDVSHHRAPYKNVTVSGFGAEGDPVTPVVTSPLDSITFINSLGLRQINPDQAQALVTKLMYMRADWISDERYKLAMYPTETIDVINKYPDSSGAQLVVMYSGAGVAKRWLDEKKIVLMTPSVIGPISTVDPELGAIPVSDTARISEIAQSGLRDSAIVFAMPGQAAGLDKVKPNPMAVSQAGFTISKTTLYVALGLGVAVAGFYGYQHYMKAHHRAY
jgi:hypothetical protein